MKKSIIAAMVATCATGIAMLPNAYALEDSCSAVKDGNTLANCITSAQTSGGTITLADNITLSSFQTINATTENAIVIDLGSYSITREQGSTFSFEKGDLTIKGNGGKIISKDGKNNGSFYVFGNGGSHLTIEKGVTLSGDSPLVIGNNGTNSGIKVDIYGDIINDIKPTGSQVDTSAIAVHGLVKTGNPEINIYGNVKGIDAGIFQAGDSTINLKEGATVEGASGIVVKSGNLNITGATVTATGDASTGSSIGDGFTSTGAAIQIDSNKTYAGNIKINITDSEITSEKGDVIQAYGDTETKTDSHLKEIKLGEDVVLTAGDNKKVLNIENSIENFDEIKDAEGNKIELGTDSSYETPGDKTELNKVIEDVKATLEEADKYTEETIKALEEALEAAEKVAKDETAGKTLIESTLDELITALDNLELKPTESIVPEPETENPNTFDNVSSYLALGTVAVLGVTGLGYAVKKKLED